MKSPDQLEAGDWHFPAEDHKTQVPGLWPADPYVRCHLVTKNHKKPWVLKGGVFGGMGFGRVFLKWSSNTPVEKSGLEIDKNIKT